MTVGNFNYTIISSLAREKRLKQLKAAEKNQLLGKMSSKKTKKK